jgi:glycolate oxidase
LGTRATKTSSGYDLLDLVVGSEGTLCIITAAVLKVIPTPSDSAGIVLQFKSVEEASHFVQPCLGSGFLPCTIELLDQRVVAVLSDHSPLPSVSGAVLLIECDGNDAESVEKEIKDTFKKRFKLTEGKEYFEGDPILMKRLIINILQKYE